MQPFPLPLYFSGMMGTGKTAIGKLVAHTLHLPFIDLDQYIEKATGQSITTIFAQHGETHFRQLESEYLLKLSHTRAVISLGGGTILKAYNRRIIARGTWINLTTTAAFIFKRIGKSKKRPKLGAHVSTDSIQQLLNQRNPLYKLAPLQVETGASSKKANAQKIVRFLSEYAFPLIKSYRI